MKSVFGTLVGGLFLTLLTSLASCSSEEPRTPNPTGPSGEVLFEQLLAFQEEVGAASGYYAGVSFNGYEAFLGNLTVYVIGERNVRKTRDALANVFGQVGEEVSISVWENTSTVADEALKREFTRTLFGDGVAFADYDEEIDRLVVGLDDVDVVTDYETRILSQLEIPREAFSLEVSRVPEPLIMTREKVTTSR